MKAELPSSLAVASWLCLLLIVASISAAQDLSTAFYKAIDAGDVRLAALLLDRGVPVDLKRAGATPLMTACSKGDREMVDLLLEHGADVNATWDRRHGGMITGDTPLTIALARGQAELVPVLLEAGADPNTVVRRDGRVEKTPLWSAVSQQSVPAVRQLLDAGANPNVKSRYWTIMMTAAREAKPRTGVEILKMLIDAGGDITATGEKDDRLPLDVASEPEIIEFLLLRMENTEEQDG